jgi:rare lipoprotein A (peptidoglycan hydrolase)
MFRGALGVGAFVCLVLFLSSSPRSDVRSISVAGAFATEEPSETPERVRDIARAEVLGVQATPIPTVGSTPVPTPEATPEPTPVAASAVATSAPPPEAPTGGIVIASWYGPGFYGNRTACGQVYTPEIIGVAHRTLRCGTMLTLEYRGRTMTVPVIDRGPYIAGRTLDLSNATRLAMGCPDLCTLSMRIAQ